MRSTRNETLASTITSSVQTSESHYGAARSLLQTSAHQQRNESQSSIASTDITRQFFEK